MKRFVAIPVLLAVLALMTSCGGSGGGSASTATDLAACPSGACGKEESTNCASPGGKACAAGFVCKDVENDGCDPSRGDADCAGACVEKPAEPTTSHCGGRGGSVCADDQECVDDPADQCVGGPAADCPGICQPKSDPNACRSDADCPTLKVRCSACRDGSVSCPQSFCEAGQCLVQMKACADLIACGGFAGISCHDGLVCEDAPDDCDPQNGGADCPGVCVAAPQPPACGGIGGRVCAEGEECVDDPSDACDPATGADCLGLCQPRTNPECKSDTDCPQIKAACSVCADGTTACPSSTCTDGRCAVVFPSCPPPVSCDDPSYPCKPGYVCGDDPNSGACNPGGNNAVCPHTCVPQEMPHGCGGIAGLPCAENFMCVDDPNDQCDPATGADCGGICVPVEKPQCTSDADCPQMAAACTQCTDGSYACPRSACENGQCTAAFEACPPPKFCGGIAAFPCAPGFTCIDNPDDNCDPNHGGADCGGICVPEKKPPQCQADADCPAIGAPCQLCADGSAACPRSFCSNGECRAEFPTCGSMTAAT